MERFKNFVTEKQVKYEIIIYDIIGDFPEEYDNDFILWLQYKAIELGCGNHNEFYYDFDETGYNHVEVLFGITLGRNQ